MQYRAVIEKEGRAFNVSFPDCPGCLTFGKWGDQVARVDRASARA
jgi:predicted RNase H-like HicB family nuclease